MSTTRPDGHENADGSQFCNACGSPTERVETPESAVTPPPSDHVGTPIGPTRTDKSMADGSNRGSDKRWLIAIIGLNALLLVVAVVVVSISSSRGSDSSSGAFNPGTSPSTVSGGNPPSSNDGDGSGGSTDPIEQAGAILVSKWGSSATYFDVKAVTDKALFGTGLELNDDSRSRAWSAVLTVGDSNSISPLTVMQCVAINGAQASMPFPDLAALCAVTGG